MLLLEFVAYYIIIFLPFSSLNFGLLLLLRTSLRIRQWPLRHWPVSCLLYRFWRRSHPRQPGIGPSERRPLDRAIVSFRDIQCSSRSHQKSKTPTCLVLMLRRANNASSCTSMDDRPPMMNDMIFLIPYSVQANGGLAMQYYLVESSSCSMQLTP